MQARVLLLKEPPLLLVRVRGRVVLMYLLLLPRVEPQQVWSRCCPMQEAGLVRHLP